MENIPRSWPILYSLYKLDKIQGHFYLQKYIYLAKVEKNLPIEYEFIRSDYGPYSPGIKSDAFILNKEDFIEMLDVGRKWVFKITDKGKKAAEKILEKIPKKVINQFDEILDEFGSYSFFDLRDYIYKHHIRTKKENEQLKKQMLIDIADLLSVFRNLESSDNSLFIRGSLDYCSIVLKREDIRDLIQKGVLLNSILSYVNEVIELNELILDKPELLSDLNLKDHVEKFDFIQNLVSRELKVFPRLDDDDIDLKLLLEEEDEKPVSTIFTGAV